MIVERYPKLNGVGGSSIPGYEIFSLLDGTTSYPLKYDTFEFCGQGGNLGGGLWL